MLFGLRPGRFSHKAHEYKAGAQIATSCNSACQAVSFVQFTGM